MIPYFFFCFFSFPFFSFFFFLLFFFWLNRGKELFQRYKKGFSDFFQNVSKVREINAKLKAGSVLTRREVLLASFILLYSNCFFFHINLFFKKKYFSSFTSMNGF